MSHESYQALDDFRRYPGFTCFKSGAPIHYPRRWQRDALIQAALDPVVDQLAPLSKEHWPQEVEFGFCVSIIGRRYACLIGGPSNRSLTREVDGLPLLWIDRTALKMEPLWSTGRAIWSRKRLAVDPVARYTTLEAASARREGVEARVLLARLDAARIDPLDQLMAMIAQGVLQGDLASGLNGGTRLRPGRDFESKLQSNPRLRLREILVGPS